MFTFACVPRPPLAIVLLARLARSSLVQLNRARVSRDLEGSLVHIGGSLVKILTSVAFAVSAIGFATLGVAQTASANDASVYLGSNGIGVQVGYDDYGDRRYQNSRHRGDRYRHRQHNSYRNDYSYRNYGDRHRAHRRGYDRSRYDYQNYYGGDRGRYGNRHSRRHRHNDRRYNDRRYDRW